MAEHKEKFSPYMVRLLNRATGVEAFNWGEQFYYSKLTRDAKRPSTLKARLISLGCAATSFLLPSIWENITDTDFNAAKFDLALWVDTLTTGSMVLGGFTASGLFENVGIGIATYFASRTFINIIRAPAFDRHLQPRVYHNPAQIPGIN